MYAIPSRNNNEYINTNALTAEIHFVVTKKPSSEQYQKKVTVVKLVKKADGLVLGTYNVNEMVEGISMDEAIAANPSAKPVAKPAPSAAPKYDEAPAEEADDTESDEEDVDAPVIESE